MCADQRRCKSRIQEDQNLISQSRISKSWVGGVTLTILLLSSACASVQPRGPATPAPSLAIADLENRALLLMLADRKSYEPLAIARALEGGAEIRRLTALGVARIGDSRGGPVLESLLADDDPQVRRSAAFGLGELGEQGYTAGGQALLGGLIDPDRETGRLAVEALAKIGAPLDEVVAGLQRGTESEILPRLLPALFRFDDDAVVAWAERGLALEDSGLRSMAAYALGREARPAGLAFLRQLTGDADPWIRSMAARGLGRVGDRADLGGLRRLLDDPAPGPIIQALRAGRQLITDGKTAPPDDWKDRLLELMTAEHPGVRLTAIEVAAVWLLDERLGEALGRLATSDLRRERELALLALAEGEDPRAAALLVRLANDPESSLRSRVAEAAGFFRAAAILEQLAQDENAGVRRTVLETRLAGEPADAEELIRKALKDEDPTVRATALDWATENPEIEMEALFAAMHDNWRDRLLDARISGTKALAARAAATATERGAVVAVLESLAQDKEYLVRREASRALAGLEREPPPTGAVRSDKSIGIYRQVVQQTGSPRRVELVTERGTVGLELACPEAPLTCLNFLQLAAQGYYEGIRFHRVVADFVVQAGDPRGDGWGGPGYAIRDEINLLRYERGRLGMALSGPDTGGSQFFITLAPQPHLDGGYTIFGRVVAGDEVLDQIVQGDEIIRIVEVPAG